MLLWFTTPSFVAYTVATTPACRQVYRDSPELGMGDIFTSVVFLAFVIMEAVAERQQYTFQTESYRRKKNDEIVTDEYDGFKQSGLFAIVRKPNYGCSASNVDELFRLPFLWVSWNWSREDFGRS
jgi:steroid 5-alpha reductase family enzyme